MNPDRIKAGEGERLADAALADGGWHSFEAQLQDRALAAFSRTARRMRLFRSAAQVLGVFAALAAAAWIGGAHRADSGLEKLAARREPNLRPQPAIRSITEAELLALFPAGSCALAEINGEKQLVFFDARVARDGVEVEGPASSAR